MTDLLLTYVSAVCLNAVKAILHSSQAECLEQRFVIKSNSSQVKNFATIRIGDADEISNSKFSGCKSIRLPTCYLLIAC